MVIIILVFQLCFFSIISSYVMHNANQAIIKTMLLSKQYEFDIDSLIFPKLVVFDLDQCLWKPEMYTLSEIPTKVLKGKLGSSGEEGNIGVYSDYEIISLYPYALQILQDYYLDKYPSYMRFAIASSADTSLAVDIGKAAMDLLEILPGVTMKQVFMKNWPNNNYDHIQIGRTYPLTSDKSTSHFPIIRNKTNILYNDMLFFDDCNWTNHCKLVELNCPGVITIRTPNGIQKHEWLEGIQKYSNIYK